MNSFLLFSNEIRPILQAKYKGKSNHLRFVQTWVNAPLQKNPTHKLVSLSANNGIKWILKRKRPTLKPRKRSKR